MIAVIDLSPRRQSAIPLVIPNDNPNVSNNMRVLELRLGEVDPKDVHDLKPIRINVKNKMDTAHTLSNGDLRKNSQRYT